MSAVYLYITASDGFSCALSIEIILVVDWIVVPDVFTSAKAKYLLSFDIVVSTAVVVDK